MLRQRRADGLADIVSMGMSARAAGNNRVVDTLDISTPTRAKFDGPALSWLHGSRERQQWSAQRISTCRLRRPGTGR
jgi:hypothetical protein